MGSCRPANIHPLFSSTHYVQPSSLLWQRHRPVLGRRDSQVPPPCQRRRPDTHPGKTSPPPSSDPLFPLARPRTEKQPCLLPLPVCSRRRATSPRGLGQAVRPKVHSLQSSLCLLFPPKLRSRSHTSSSLFTLHPPLSALNTISTSTPRPTHPDQYGRTLSTTRPLSSPSPTRTGTNTPPPIFPRPTRTGGKSNTDINPSRRSTSRPPPTDRLRERSFWLIRVGSTRRSALGIRSRRS